MSSSLTAEALNQFLPSEWYVLLGQPQCGLREWVRLNKFQIRTPPASDAEFSLSFTDESSALMGIAFDCNRFLSAAIETFHDLSPSESGTLKNGAAWLAIKSYYASFYAAHALLRIFGRSCTQLDPAEISIVNKVAQIYYPNAPVIKGGYYNGRIDSAQKTIIFTREAGKRPHHQLWFEFDLLLEELIQNLRKGSTRYQQVMVQLQSLKTNINYNNRIDGAWLSSIREEINYRHGYNAWFPYQGAKKDRTDKILRLIKMSNLDSLKVSIDGSYKNDDLARFFGTATYLVTLCCEIIIYMNGLNPRTFPKHGPLKLLNLLRPLQQKKSEAN